jgi:hypothetical protein
VIESPKQLMTILHEEVAVCPRPQNLSVAVASAIIGYDMSKVATPKAKPARRVRGKAAPIKASTRRRLSKTEDRLDGAAATKALRESAERISYQKARRDLGL